MKIPRMIAFLFFSFFPFAVFALTPMEYFNSLVAGQDDPGFQDGAFDEAAFNHPVGLAFDSEGNRLFVADQYNHRIRTIYLYENQRVETLVGSNIEGNQDGSFDAATFKEPTAIVSLPDDQLAVYDVADTSIRLIDMKNKNVSTLAESLTPAAWSMVYFPKDNSLYLSDPLKGCLERVDLKTKKADVVLSNNPKLTQPKALCVYQNHLYVSDGATSAIYRVEPAYNSLSAVTSVDVILAGKGDHTVAMAVSDDFLCALQSGGTPLAEVLPEYKPIDTATAWGFLAQNDSYAYSPFLKISNDIPGGFIVSPKESRKMFISEKSPYDNCIVSVKNYDFKENWGARDGSYSPGVISDFNYPDKKPPQTYRILIAGNSMVVTAPRAFSDKDSAEHDGDSFRSDTFGKELEFFLNAQASLKNIPEHYEVLELGHPGGSFTFYANSEVPSLVQKYGVDMVIDFVTPYEEEQFDYYYHRPLTSEGIPFGSNDPEFLLKPASEKIPPGAPSDLFENAKKRGIASISASNQITFNCTFQSLLNTNDKGIRADLVEMLGKPLRVLSDKLKSSQTSDGKPVRFLVCFTPNEGSGPLSNYESFWTDLCFQNQLDFLDFSKPFNDMKVQFFPTMEECCHQHFTAYGNTLIAYLLGYYLPEQHWIPFGSESDTPQNKP